MIVIVGESASGKTTLVNDLIKKHPEFHKIVTYTTRPKRDNEVEGIDYYFVSEEKFKSLVEQDYFVEHAKYRDRSYGTAKKYCVKDKNAIVILTPAGMRSLKKINKKATSIYVYVDRRSRLINILLRGDNVDEAYRRNLSDLGQFDGITNEVDYVIDNTQFHMNEDEVLKCLEAILKIGDNNVKTF